MIFIVKLFVWKTVSRLPSSQLEATRHHSDETHLCDPKWDFDIMKIFKLIFTKLQSLSLQICPPPLHEAAISGYSYYSYFWQNWPANKKSKPINVIQSEKETAIDFDMMKTIFQLILASAIVFFKSQRERARPTHQTFGGLLKQDDFCTKSHEVFPLKKECCSENIGFYFKVVEFHALK